MAANPQLPMRAASPARLSDRSGSSSPSLMPAGSPQYSPRRRTTDHLTPDHRPRSLSPSRTPSHPDSYPSAQGAIWRKSDPRSSSMQSLLPVESAGSSRRTLLLIYIHGFLGNESSFKSFPAHVHNILTATLSDSHVVHTKIYPRYRSRKPIEHARDDFSNWLTPHESSETDVVLVGHSLGGILAAEVTLLQPYSSRYPDARLHSILGLLAFDTPFLGMHPGVVSTGITSLFRPKPEFPAKDTSSRNQLYSQPSASSQMGDGDPASWSTFSEVPDDPNYNPPFPNDTQSTERKGLNKALYFINKHSDGLVKASTDYVTSHLEFGGCLADYPGLKRRYRAIRAMEDVNELIGQRDSQNRPLRRVRFVNYYSASTGRLKHLKSPNEPPALEMKNMSQADHGQADAEKGSLVLSDAPRVSLEEYRNDGNLVEKELEKIGPESTSDQGENEAASQKSLGYPSKHSNTEALKMQRGAGEKYGPEPASGEQNQMEGSSGLHTMPSLGPPPADFDSLGYMDTDHLKLAQQGHARPVKGHERARKDQARSIRERNKLFRKREKASKKEAQKAARVAAANKSIQEHQNLKRAATLNPEVYDRQLAQDAEERKSGASTEQDIQQIKKQRDRKFCTLPSKDPSTGIRDSTWIRVYMEGVDEVTAHTSLFIPEGTTYERLVGDAAERIENWVKDDQGLRAALQSRALR